MFLFSQNCSLAVVGKDTDFVVYDDDAVQPFLDLIKDEQADQPRAGPGDDPGDDADAGPAAPPPGEAMDVEEPPAVD